MAKDNIIGLKMELDVADLKSGIAEVNKNIQASKKEFAYATAGMDKWSKSSDGLNAKLKQLKTQLDNQQKAVSGYQAEIERVSQLEGDHSRELENLKGKLLQAETQVKQTEQQIGYYSKSLETVTKEEKKAESATTKLSDTIKDQKEELADLQDEYKSAVITYGKNSKEARALENQIGKLSDEIEQNENKMKKADKALNNLGTGLEKVSSIGKNAGKIFAGIGAGVAGLATAFLSTAESTRELRTNMSKLDTAFTSAGMGADEARKTYQDFYSILGDEGKATEAVAHLSKITKSQQELDKWTQITAGVYATFGDSLPIEGLTEAANETAKVGQLTGVLADALTWAGVSEDSFQESLENCNSEQERSELISKTLNALYGETGQLYRENNKDIIASNSAQAQLAQTMADLGAQAEPVVTELKLMGAELASKLLPVVNKLIPTIKKNLPQIVGLIAGVTAGIIAMSAASTIAKGVTLAFNAVAAVRNALLIKDTAATTAKTAATVASTAATQAATVAQKLFNLVMAANPIALVVIAIGALVAAFAILWNTSEDFRNFWINLWNSITGTIEKVVPKITGFFSGAWDTIKNVWNGAKIFFTGIADGISGVFSAIPKLFVGFFTGAWNGISGVWDKVVNFFAGIFMGIVSFFSAIPATLSAFFSQAWEGIVSVWDNVGNFFSGIVSTIISFFTAIPQQMGTIGKNMVEGLWQGISDMTSWVTDKIKGFSDSVLSGIKDFFGIHSPSTVMKEVGGNLTEGLIEGIEENETSVTEAGQKQGTDYITGVSDGAKNPSIMQRLFEWLKKTLGDAGKGIIDMISKALGLSIGESVSDGIKEGSKVGIDSLEETLKSVDKRNPLEKFIDGIESALKLTDKDMAKWAKGAGKYFSKVASAAETVVNKVGEFTSALSQLANAKYDNAIAELQKEREAYAEAKDLELEQAQENHETDMELLDERTNEEMRALEESYYQGLISYDEYYDKKTNIANSATAKEKLLLQGIADKEAEIRKAKDDYETENLKRQNEFAKKQFEANKRNARAEAYVQGAIAAAKGFAMYGIIGGIANLGLTAASVAAQVAVINSQQFVPLLAKGGIVDSATLAVVGESGREAVMPLENNTQWINELAEKLNTIMMKDFTGVELNRDYLPEYSSVPQTVNNYYEQVINSPKLPTRLDIYRDTKNLLALKGV